LIYELKKVSLQS